MIADGSAARRTTGLQQPTQALGVRRGRAFLIIIKIDVNRAALTVPLHNPA
jgi:hypothetical protein